MTNENLNHDTFTSSNTDSMTTTVSDEKQSSRYITEDFLLVWLDASIDKSKQVYLRTLADLRSVVNNVIIFTQSSECINHLGKLNDTTVF